MQNRAGVQPEEEQSGVATLNPAHSVIRFENVSKKYMRRSGRTLLRQRLVAWLVRAQRGSIHAIQNVSFEINSGESLAIVGSNGAGKSTLLRLAIGIAPPDSGRIIVNGTTAGLIELGAGFHPDLTGAENLVLNASLLGLTRQQTYEQFDSIVEFSGIRDFIHEPLRTYSGGMVLRLAFSVAIRVDPDILFIDEILSVGDKDFQRKCVDEIKGLKDRGKTLVCVAHQMEVLRDLCEVALWLDHGEIKMFGPAKTVLDSYELGKVNLSPF
jgi:lipopolysaccharide transport system ATP-binding protein